MSTRQSKGLQHFIEAKAAGPAFLIAAASTMLRGATFWSGGAFTVGGLLGPAGLRIFNGLTGFGIAVGAELLASIFGRQWLRYKSETHEAQGRAGLRRTERAALVKEYVFRARLSLAFMGLGILASTAAGFMFLLSSTSTQSIGSAIGELLITVILVSIITAIGVFYEARADDAGEIATEQARTLRGGIVDAAGRRIAAGNFTPQDVRIVARALPRAEREKFEAALLPPSADDPHWTTRDIAAWLDCDTSSGRRQVTRKLAKLYAAGAGVQRDDRSGYAVPRSTVFQHFAEDFLAIHERGSQRDTPTARVATEARQNDAPGAVSASGDSDTGGQRSGQRQALELPLGALQAQAAPALASQISTSGMPAVTYAAQPGAELHNIKNC